MRTVEETTSYNCTVRWDTLGIIPFANNSCSAFKKNLTRITQSNLKTEYQFIAKIEGKLNQLELVKIFGVIIRSIQDPTARLLTQPLNGK